MASRAVHHLLAIAHRKIIRDRNRFIVGDEKAVLRARRWAPGAHAGVGAGLQQIDRRTAAVGVGSTIVRHPFFVTAPAEFGRLHALGNKTLHRPGVDEHVHRLRLLGALGVAFGDMDALDAKLVGELAPAFATFGLVERRIGVAGDVEQRLLDEPGHHARIGAAGGDRGRPARALVFCREQGLAQRVIGALFGPDLLVEIEAEPRLHDRVDIERADFAAQRHDIDRGGVDRQIDAKALAAAGGKQRHQRFAIIVLGDRLLDKAHAVLFCQFAILMRIDDDEAGFVIGKMPFDQRQRAFADRAEADHDNGARNFRMDLLLGRAHHGLQKERKNGSGGTPLGGSILRLRAGLRAFPGCAQPSHIRGNAV